MKTHFETPQEIRQQLWKELGRASQDRHHAWRTPVLATAAGDGSVNARTVVLRDVDAAQGTLLVFTDQRSPKVAELDNQPNALFVFWSPRLNWQLRVRVNITAHASGSPVQARWQRVKQSATASDYLGQLAPGTPRLDAPDTSAVSSQNNHFALLSAHVSEMDWLELGRSGHRRARLRGDHWEWLTP